MVDFINQGKGDVSRIWGIKDNETLRDIYVLCCDESINFYNPTEHEMKAVKECLISRKNNSYETEINKDNEIGFATTKNEIEQYFCVKYKLVNLNAKPPIRKTEHSSGFDLAICEDVAIAPFGIGLADTGIAFEIPKFIDMQIRPRSSTSAKYKQVVAIGTIDSDYRGTVKIVLLNFSNSEVFFSKGTRLAQAVFNYKPNIELEEATELSKTVRDANGFGHTGIF